MKWFLQWNDCVCYQCFWRHPCRKELKALWDSGTISKVHYRLLPLQRRTTIAHVAHPNPNPKQNSNHNRKLISPLFQESPVCKNTELGACVPHLFLFYAPPKLIPASQSHRNKFPCWLETGGPTRCRRVRWRSQPWPWDTSYIKWCITGIE